MAQVAVQAGTGTPATIPPAMSRTYCCDCCEDRLSTLNACSALSAFPSIQVTIAIPIVQVLCRGGAHVCDLLLKVQIWSSAGTTPATSHA